MTDQTIEQQHQIMINNFEAAAQRLRQIAVGYSDEAINLTVQGLMQFQPLSQGQYQIVPTEAERWDEEMIESAAATLLVTVSFVEGKLSEYRSSK